MDERTYSEREVAAIIERAVERQEEARRARPEAGLSLAELERLGREVGIDPAHLRAAAAEVDAGGTTFGRVAEQTDTHVVVERWIAGPLDVTAWEDAALELEGRFGADAGAAWGRSAGGLRQAGNTYEWSHTSGLGVETRVVVRARGERTQLRLTQKVGVARPAVEGPLWGGVMTLLLALLPALSSFGEQPALVAAITAAAFVLFSGLTFHFDRRWRAKKLRDLDTLADELAGKLAAAPAADALPVRPPARLDPAPTGALDLDTLADDTLPPATEREADPVRPRRTRS